MQEGSAHGGAGECAFCPRPITADELDNPDLIYREVSSWVTGAKLQSPVLREQTGRVAHAECVSRLVVGQATDQEVLPGLDPEGTMLSEEDEADLAGSPGL
jgi:hypothetical protein